MDESGPKFRASNGEFPLVESKRGRIGERKRERDR
jgi:hypothetical protein